MSLWKALRDGIVAATRTQSAAPLAMMFVVNLVIALALTVPMYAAVGAWVGHRLAARDLAHDFDGMLALESLLSVPDPQELGNPVGLERQAATTSLTVMIGTALVAWLLAPLPHVVFGGGALLTYTEGRFAWRRFLWGAWRWLLPFAVLSFLFAVCASFVLALGIGAWIAIQSARMNVLATPALAITALAYLALTMTFEYAQVIAVAEQRRNVFWALGRATMFIKRQPVRTSGLYLLMGTVSMALIPLYSGVVAPIIPFAWGWIGIAAQQLWIVGRLWARLARWAGEVALYQQEAEMRWACFK